MERHSTTLVIGRRQIRTKMRNHFAQIRMGVVKKHTHAENSKGRWGRGKIEMLWHCWWLLNAKAWPRVWPLVKAQCRTVLPRGG